jgi:hypothetical protein
MLKLFRIHSCQPKNEVTPMKKVRLGIIGLGSHGSGHTRNILNGLSPELELTAVCDIWKN